MSTFMSIQPYFIISTWITILITYSDFIINDGWVNSKTSGKMRLEGKEYIVKDGDILNFRFNT